MTNTWRPPTGRHLDCGWERDNPEPHLCPADECVEYCDWAPTIRCHHYPEQRVIMDDGRFFDVCDARGHEVWGEVIPILGCRWEPRFDQAMKYFYRDIAVELADMEHPIAKLARR